MKFATLMLTLAVLLSDSVLASANYGNPISTTVVVTYGDGETRFMPPPDVAAALSDANKAALIYISGRTSTDRPSAADEALAFKRAAAARAHLIRAGVSPLKIMVNYVSGADFVADNTTRWGRRANQRVEIELVYVPVRR